MSNMLDSASAQFAASALVTSDQLLTLKVKEDGIVGSGVNGILQASGEKNGYKFLEIKFLFSFTLVCSLTV